MTARAFRARQVRAQALTTYLATRAARVNDAKRQEDAGGWREAFLAYCDIIADDLHAGLPHRARTARRRAANAYLDGKLDPSIFETLHYMHPLTLRALKRDVEAPNDRTD